MRLIQNHYYSKSAKDIMKGEKAVFGEFRVIDIITEQAVDTAIGWHYEVIPTDAISRCEPFCYPMPLNHQYVKRCEMKVIGNIYDNPELLGGTK